MAITLPFPVRVAVGILATGIDRVRSLPEDIPAIPVALVGNALKLSMKLQQEIATLATRGDEVLGGVVNAPQENPSWAKFDDDEPAAPVTRIKPATPPAAKPGAAKPAATKSGTAKPGTAKPGTAKRSSAKPGASGSPAGAPAKAPVNTPPDLIGGPADAPGLSTPAETAMAPVTTTAMDAAIDVVDDLVELATVAADDKLVPDPTSGVEKIRAAEKELDAEEAASLGAFEAGQVPDEVLDSVIIGETDELTEGLQLPADLVEDVLIEAEAEAVLEEIAEVAAAEELLEEIAEVEAVEELLEEAAEIEAVEELLEEAAEIQAAGELIAEPTVFQTAEVLSEIEDEALEPVVFGETGDLTAVLPISDELIEEIADEAQQAQQAQDTEGPTALPGYESMTLAQVRGHLRELTPADVSELLAYEQSGDNRAPFLTLLSNRLVTLDAQNS
ncbi:MAG: hypothetical protein ABWZ02_03865 [Nakamurella sp.]